MATLYPPTGDPQEVTPKHGDYFTLTEFYTHLRCSMIQMLPLTDGTVLVFDEEGKLKPSEFNRHATQIALAFSRIAREDCIVGSALVCSRVEAGYH